MALLSAITTKDGRDHFIAYLQNVVSGATQTDKFYIKSFWLLKTIVGAGSIAKFWDPAESPITADNLYQYRLADDATWSIANRTPQAGYKVRLTLTVPTLYTTGVDRISGVAIIAEDDNANEYLLGYGTFLTTEETFNKPTDLALVIYVDLQL